MSAYNENRSYDELRSMCRQTLTTDTDTPGVDPEETHAAVTVMLRRLFGAGPLWFLVPLPEWLPFGTLKLTETARYNLAPNPDEHELPPVPPRRQLKSSATVLVDCDGRSYWPASGPLVAAARGSRLDVLDFDEVRAVLDTDDASARLLATTWRKYEQTAITAWWVHPPDASVSPPRTDDEHYGNVSGVHVATRVLFSARVAFEPQVEQALPESAPKTGRGALVFLGDFRVEGVPDEATKEHIADWLAKASSRRSSTRKRRKTAK